MMKTQMTLMRQSSILNKLTNPKKKYLSKKLKFNFSKLGKYESKELIFGKKARDLLLQGSRIVSRTAKVSLGPKGRNAALEVEYKAQPKITKDGVTIIKNIREPDQKKEVGVSLMRQASHNTNEYCGDGTTTVSILANAILEKGLKMIEAGYNPIEVKRGIEVARDEIIDFFDMIAEPIETRDHLYNAAMVSTNYDEGISEVIATAIEMKGDKGVIHIEPFLQGETSVVYVEGGSINRGVESEDFLKKEADMKIEMVNPRVLVLDFKVLSLKETTDMLDRLKNFQEPVFILAKYISKECLSQMIYNHSRDLLDVVIITFPGEQNQVSGTLQDYAAVFNARVFDEFDSDEIVDIELSDLGKASKVEIGRNETFFIGVEDKTKEHSDRLEERIRVVESLHNNSSDLEKVLYQSRLDGLSGNMTLIKLGGDTEIEQQEIKDKLVDGLNSVKNSLKEGVIPGGGAALVHASELLHLIKTSSEEKNAGIEVMRQVCFEPIYSLCDNAGLNGAYIAQKLLEEYKDPEYGFNLNTNQFENMIESGIYDSVYNAKNILADAVSIGGMMLTCEVMIVQRNRYLPSNLDAFPKDVF